MIWVGSRKFSSQVFRHSRWTIDWGSREFNLLGIYKKFSADLNKIDDLNYDIQLPKILAMSNEIDEFSLLLEEYLLLKHLY